MNFEKLLNKYRTAAKSKAHLGSSFERVIKRYLLTEPIYAAKFEKIWLWNEFPGRDSISRPDIGIDLVALTKSGDYWAIQCKCYYEGNRISKGDVDTFITTSGVDFLIKGEKKKRQFAHRLFVSTTNQWSAHAEQIIEKQTIPVTRINLAALEASVVDWEKIDKEAYVSRESLSQKRLRSYQEEAITKAIKHYKTADRGKLIMACGTGKTYTSLKLAERLTNNQGFILVLVPSISLVDQLMKEWYLDSEKTINGVAVCSDPTAGRIKDDDLRSSLIDLPIDATTDPEKVIVELNANNKGKGLKVIFSTYHSIEVVQRIQQHFREHNPRYGEFDLIICDEAHRTTGVEYKESKKRSYFVKVHDNDYIRARKRLYMTATPKLYGENSKKQASSIQAAVWSMDDKEHFGREFFRITFGEAVERGNLSDYKVIILTISEKDIPEKILVQIKERYKKKDGTYATDDIVKLAGVYNAISKKFLFTKEQEIMKKDPNPMLRAVAYCSSIPAATDTSNNLDFLSEQFARLDLPDSEKLQYIDGDFITGKMSATKRSDLLSWLKRTDPDGKTRLLTNVRCLSEGVDVPSLDAVIFLAKRNSYIDIVQSVGRVMRKSEGKKYGYIIIPVVIADDADPNLALDQSKDFKTVWAVLNALRAHDDRLENVVQKLQVNQRWPDNIITARPLDSGGGKFLDSATLGGGLTEQQVLEFRHLQRQIYGRIVDRVGNRRYWEDWAKDVGEVAKKQIERIRDLIAQSKVTKHVFDEFLEALQKNINPSVSQEEAIEMLAQHIIIKPIFVALFKDYDFAASNPVSMALTNVIVDIETKGKIDPSRQLQKFYQAVTKKIEGIDNDKGRQKIIIDLYEKFFQTAFPRMAEQLGIVYTPIEIVDFILQSVNDISEKEFGKGLNHKDVGILDPFTGTGTFISRLLHSGLISKENLKYKYQNEIWANEIVPLAYYVSAINIENSYHEIMSGKYVPFKGICLTDTFQLGEEKLKFASMLPKNSERVQKQSKSQIKIIVGNPPYSAGQKTANDNAQNQTYELLEKRIQETYAAHSNSSNKSSLYDAYFKAFRWSTDRLKKDGIVCFVSNGGWLESNSGSGFRKTIENEFSSIYVFDLKGNIRKFKKEEGGNVFGSASMTPITITLLVKNQKKQKQQATIYYHDIGDFLSNKEKLKIIKELKTFENEIFKTTIKPNKTGDWINQRSEFANNFLSLKPKKISGAKQQTFFAFSSLGICSNRDAWVYNNSKNLLKEKIKKTIFSYNFQRETFHSPENKEKNIDKFISSDHSKISWTEDLKRYFENNKKIIFDKNLLRISLYRPFFKSNLYFSRDLNSRRRQIPFILPSSKHQNLIICITCSGEKKDFSCLITDRIPDYHLLASTNCFPFYYYQTDSNNSTQQKQFSYQKSEKDSKRDGISDYIWEKAKNLYRKDISKKDIFYYVYGFLHNPEYRTKFANTLKKENAQIPLLENEDHFWKFSEAGRELAELHLNFENQKPLKEIKINISDSSEDINYEVTKMRFVNKEDKSEIIYNNQITISNIPQAAYEYRVSGKSAIEWVLDRQQIKTDKKSGIVNDPNKWGEEQGNPRYILDLLLSVITLSVKTVEIVNSLPKIKF